jgi:Fe-S-cluster containining protein
MATTRTGASVMKSDAPDAGETATATVELSGPDWQLQARMTVPRGPTRVIEFLPLARSLADAMVASTVQGVEEGGQTVSCKKGCGACCRQLVPVAEVEARRLRDVVEELPEPRRSQVRARFAEARRRLDAAGLLETLLRRAEWQQGDHRAVGDAYFRQGIPCPFLEEESCSIYEDRPIACREYLVTSPAENCARPSAETVRCVKMPLQVWASLARLDPLPEGARSIRWVPLSLAPEWADAHADEAPPRPGPELLRELFAHLTRNPNVPAPPPGPPVPGTEGPPCPPAP